MALARDFQQEEKELGQAARSSWALLFKASFIYTSYTLERVV